MVSHKQYSDFPKINISCLGSRGNLKIPIKWSFLIKNSYYMVFHYLTVRRSSSSYCWLADGKNKKYRTVPNLTVFLINYTECIHSPSHSIYSSKVCKAKFCQVGSVNFTESAERRKIGTTLVLSVDERERQQRHRSLSSRARARGALRHHQ